jgi:hypothetical protein
VVLSTELGSAFLDRGRRKKITISHPIENIDNFIGKGYGKAKRKEADPPFYFLRQ